MCSLSSRVSSVALVLMIASACSRPAPQAPKSEAADAKVRALADAYLAGYFERFPDQLTYYGVPNSQHDRLPDNSLEAVKAWEGKEDAWLNQAKAINPERIESESLNSTYAIVREALESAIQARSCRSELWNVSQMTGWQVNFGYLVTIQPVGTEDARRATLARWNALPRYLDTEVENLREGIRLNYTAPRLNVRIVIDQVDGLIKTAAVDQPFLSPAARDTNEAFRRDVGALYADALVPAMKRYRDFLQNEYLAAARDVIAVTANRNGAECYAAAIRLHSAVQISPAQVHDVGLREVESLTREMTTIARASFGARDLGALLRELRANSRYLFKNRKELIDYSRAALLRAKAQMPDWFGMQPKADVRIEPYPAFREKNAANEYNAPAEDGSRPGLFYINAYQAEKKTKAPVESTAFHETIPGHHLQIAIALERAGIHPIGRYLGNSGFTEGWALYSERLASEMGLYSADLDRLGMLSSQAFRASRLVIDSGIHSKGWTRQQAIDYMLAHTAEDESDAISEIDRYIVWPGQATAYMLGKLEIQSAREAAMQTLGARFDIRAFHDRVLEDGAVPVSFLAAKIRAWASAQ